MSANPQIVQHPVLSHHVSVLRNAETNSADFRRLTKVISTILAIEAGKDLNLRAVENLNSPQAPYTGSEISDKLAFCPILRAGLGMCDGFSEIYPDAPIHHLGLFRDKHSLLPVEYYCKLPSQPQVDKVYILDPLIATGGTACAAVGILLDWGIALENIKLISIIASSDGIEKIREDYPGLQIVVASVDKELTPQGIVSPGVGDVGDRLFAPSG